MDRHIDNRETQKYGPQLRLNLAVLSGAPVDKPVREFVGWLVARQKKVDDLMSGAMDRASGAAVDLSQATEQRAPAEKTARTLLSAFSDHLRSKKKIGDWKGDPRTFFPRPMHAISGARQVKAALEAVLKGFAKEKSVPEGASYKKRFTAAQEKLAKEVSGAGGAFTTKKQTLSEQSKEKKAWLATYRPIGAIADGLLALLGLKTKKRTTLIPHRAAPGKRGAAKKKGGKAPPTTPTT